MHAFFFLQENPVKSKKVRGSEVLGRKIQQLLKKQQMPARIVIEH
jgi:hypothetical protein